MMDFIDQIKQDMYSAMKSGDKIRTNILRTLLSSLKEKQIEKKDSLNEEEYFGVIKRFVKQLKEAADAYQKAGRLELAEKETLELNILKKYLPEIFSEEQTLNLVKEVIAQTSANNLSDMGKVMSAVMQQSNGKVDGGIANRLVKELLQ
ncbi:uncharacterized protein METZ01_LOCUS118479 [marine metagenome]|jgi:uncharacterized protein YqeY|uniref:GatB/YqeY domain-containing protein n=1 Tax=marine metagenome TaxID=408172 RepID=A0A381XLH6_9ZZZZ